MISQQPFINNLTINLIQESLSSGGAWDSNGVYDKSFLTNALNYILSKKYKNIFDIGASTGQFAFFPLFDSEIRVWSFEPQKVIYDLLTENVQANAIDNNTRCFNLALSHQRGEVQMNKPSNRKFSGLATLSDDVCRFSNVEKETIQTTTLDYFVEQQGIDQIDLIKIDTEGHEYYVIQGATATLQRFKPDLILEINDDNLKQSKLDRDSLFKLLESLNYQLQEQIGSEDYLYTMR